MLISFFEEFFDEETIEKLKLVKWPSKLYLAAKNLEEFNERKSRIRSKNIKEVVYWPVLEVKEGYWISPFSERKAILRIFKEIKNRMGKNSILTTYSCARIVRDNLRKAGFKVFDGPKVGRRGPSTIAEA